MSRKVLILLIVASVLVVTASALVYWPLAKESRTADAAPDMRPAASPTSPATSVTPPAAQPSAPAAPSATLVPPPPSPPPALPEPSTAARRANATLPGLVAEMRDAILAASRSGKLEELLIPIQWNELKPDFGEMRAADPIAHFRAVSQDGTGAEVLAVLARLLETAPTITRQGRDIENNRMFVWPAAAEQPMAKLDIAARADLTRLAGDKAAAAMIAEGRYRGWRLAIGADGTWHSFRRVE